MLRILLLDNYDSFTYNLYDYLKQLGAELIVYRNDELNPKDIEQLEIDALLFSPGPQRPQQAGNLTAIIQMYYNKLPMLGVCLGHQALGEFFGAQLIKAQIPMHGKTSEITHRQKAIFENLPMPMQVMRYHSLILEDCPNDCQVLAETKNGEIMALKHNILPIFGIQFHPESILTPQGIQLLDNWLKTLKSD